MSDFCLVRTDRLNILLIKHDVIRSRGEVEDAPLRRRHAVKRCLEATAVLPRLGSSLVRRKVLNENGDVLDTAAKFLRQRIQSLFCNLNEIFALHPSPTEARARSLGVAVVKLARGLLCISGISVGTEDCVFLGVRHAARAVSVRHARERLRPSPPESAPDRAPCRSRGRLVDVDLRVQCCCPGRHADQQHQREATSWPILNP